MIDATSDTWFTLHAFLTQKLADFREELESPAVDPRRADALRGAIGLVKETLDLPSAEVPPEPLLVDFFDEESK